MSGSHVRRHPSSLGAVTTVLVLLSSTGALAGASPTPVVNTPAIDWESTRAPGFLAYTQNSAGRPNHFDLYVKADAAPRWRTTTNATSGAHPGIELGNSHLGDAVVWSRGRRDAWDLAFTDLTTRDPIPVPSGINTNRAEREPSISGDHLLFARGPRSGAPYADTVILYDLATDTKRVLDSTDRGLVNAGWVSGDYAVWQKCPGTFCSIWRYQISTDTTLRLPADVPVVYSPAVTGDGTVFYVRSGFSCGQHTKIVKVSDDGTTKQTVYSFPDGVDATDLFAYPNDSKTVDVYLSRVPCRTFDFDVYVLSGV
jgi:hypothetical protein